MVVCFPSTPKKLAMTVACFLSGAAILAVGAHLSFVNIGPQQARTMARDEMVRERLLKKYGYVSPYPQQARSTPPQKALSMPPQQARNTARNDLLKETLSDFGFKK